MLETNKSRINNIIVDLCMHYAKDSSEQANIIASGIIKDTLHADEVALFYHSGSGPNRVSFAGTNHLVSLDKERWEKAVAPVAQKVSNPYHIAHFGPWKLPGFGESRPYWTGALLWQTKDSTGYLLMGRTQMDWSREDALILKALVEVIGPIVEIRNQEEEAKKEAKENLQRFEAILLGSPDMIYSTDHADRIKAINPAGLAFLGYTTAKELTGKPFESLALNSSDRQNLTDRVRTDGVAINYEIILMKKDGGHIFASESTIAMRNHKGEIIEYIGMIRDITQKIEDEQRLWTANHELIEVNEKLKETQEILLQQEKLASIGQLSAGIAHEINNPLGYLKSNHNTLVRYLSQMQEFFKGEHALPKENTELIVIHRNVMKRLDELTEMAKESEEGFNRIIKIIRDLKSFSHESSADDYTDYDINEGLESSLAMAWNEIKYVADVEKNFRAHDRIHANGGELNQVFLNILVNAAQAIQSEIRHDRGHIWIETSQGDQAVTVMIADDGPGIPEKIRTRIFDPFFTTKEANKGTGLGLSISHGIIEKHKGSIRVSPRTRKGTIFHITIPIKPPTK